MNSDKKIEYISNWIKEYASSLSFQPATLVIGVSGGVDSAVTSTLCARTGFKTIAISMPIKQNSSQHNLSLKHLDWLNTNFDNLDTLTIELDKVFESFENTLKDFNITTHSFNGRNYFKFIWQLLIYKLKYFLPCNFGNLEF